MYYSIIIITIDYNPGTRKRYIVGIAVVSAQSMIWAKESFSNIQSKTRNRFRFLFQTLESFESK